MAYTLSEEYYKKRAKELQLEDEDDLSKDIAHIRDIFKHIEYNHLLMSPALGSILFDGLKMTTFHISTINHIDQMSKIVGVKNKKPVSSFTYMTKDQLRNMGGIQTDGGIIYELEGTAIYSGSGDIMSIPDQTFRRWLRPSDSIPDTLRNEYANTMNQFKKENTAPLIEDKLNRLKYILNYDKVVLDFVRSNREQMRAHALRDRYSSYNEILLQQFIVRDVLMSVNNVGNGRTPVGEYGWILEYRNLNSMMDRRELNEHEMAKWKSYHKMLNEIQMKIQRFATGDLTYTEDNNVALSWVRERKGLIDSEEFSKTLKDITENKTNKKMSKKIKISESQLKTIMERRHTYVGDTNEEEKFDIDQLEDKDKEKVDVKKPEEVKEQDFGMDSETPETEVDEMEGGDDLSVRMAILSHLNDLFVGDPSSRKTRVNFIKVLVRKFVDKDINISEDKLDDLWEEVSGGDLSGNALNDSNPEEMEEPVDTEEIPTDNEEGGMMNESIKNIRNNFKRFL